MITRINGILLEKIPPNIVVDVNGIGYEVFVPMSTVYALPDLGEKVILHTHFLVREDLQALFGFATIDERKMFRELLKANGVGPKVALNILSGLSLDELIFAINNGDSSRLNKIPGVGKKTAERLVIEMQDRIKKTPWTSPLYARGESPLIKGGSAEGAGVFSSAIADAIAALESLGYKSNQAKLAVDKIYQENQSCEELIKSALKII